MRLTGDPARFSLAELSALCERDDAVPTRPFVVRLLGDGRAGARALGERLERLLAATARERARQERMLVLERRCWEAGVEHVAGVDEAGMGPLAGPVVAAAVVFARDRVVAAANDSKQLDTAARERLEPVIRETATCFAIGVVSVEEIDELDIYRAGLLAMRRAVVGLSTPPGRVLVDARTIPDLPMQQEAHIKGDARSCTIAAASILAKVHRDRVMGRLAELHPGYGFESHFGYATPEHLEALRRLGPCAAHRRSWRSLADHAGELSDAYYALKTALAAAGTDEELDAWRMAVQSRLPALTPDEVRRLDDLARRRPRALSEASGQLMLGDAAS